MKTNKYISVKTVFPIALLVIEAYWYKLTYSVSVSASDMTTSLTSVSYPRFILILMMVCTVGVFIWELVLCKKGVGQSAEEEDEGNPTGAAAGIQEAFEAAEAEKAVSADSSCESLTEEDPKAARWDIVKVIILIVAVFLYSLVLSKIGFIISTALLMLLAGILYGQRNKVLLISVPVLFPILLYVVFRFALRIYLPTLFI